MKLRLLSLALACSLVGGVCILIGHAQQRGGATQGPARLGFSRGTAHLPAELRNMPWHSGDSDGRQEGSVDR
jgi:hypothetical protein